MRMSQKDILKKIAKIKKEHTEIYNVLIKQLYGQELSWEDVQKLPEKDLAKLYLAFRDAIIYMQSPLSLQKLAYAIQASRSGIGGSAITEFECKFCGKKDHWSNTSTPGICFDCAKDMAFYIITKFDIFKDNTTIIFKEEMDEQSKEE